MNRATSGFVLPCHASNIRGKLKHTYLTNKVCLKTLSEDLMESMLSKDMEQGVLQKQIIRDLLDELINVMSSPAAGFSPAQLIDQLKPFQALSEEKKELLKAKVHDQFIEKFTLFNRQSRLKKASDEFMSALDLFLLKNGATLSNSKAEMEVVQERARELMRELDTLPKGIWLWDKGKKTANLNEYR